MLSSPLGQAHFPHWGRAWINPLTTKSLKEHTRTCPGQAKFESYLSKGQAVIQDSFKP